MFSQTSTISTPLVITKTYSISNYDFSVVGFVPNEFISFNVYLRDTNGNYIKNLIVDLSGNEYKEWGNDDSYITNYIEAAIKKDLCE